ncbi:unnamed protein product [Gadus morhua 'NCC']
MPRNRIRNDTVGETKAACAAVSPELAGRHLTLPGSSGVFWDRMGTGTQSPPADAQLGETGLDWPGTWAVSEEPRSGVSQLGSRTKVFYLSVV